MPESKTPSSLHSPCRTLAIVNQKGGVGKTTTAVNLATALAAIDKKVVLIDLDPQGNASTGLGIPQTDRTPGSYQLLFGEKSFQETLRSTLVPNLSIVPASSDLAGAEIELVTKPHREHGLRNALWNAKPPVDADYILIDCPPSLGLLTLNALVAAAAILVPLQCEFYALEGLSQLTRTVDRVRRTFNPTLDIFGIILTMFDKRNNLSEQVAADVRRFFGSRVFNTAIPRNVKMSEAPSHGKPALLYDFNCSGSQAYVHLAKEMLKRETQRGAA